jgi:Na+/proline symporter
MTPFQITFLGALGVLLSFLVYGILHKSDVQSYFNCNKQLGRNEFGDSFAAASTSLATVLFFFVTLGLENGLYILISPLSYLIGIVLFNKYILPKLESYGFANSNHDGSISVGSTLGLFMEQRFGSKWIKMLISVIMILGIISILLIELYVGVDIFNIFINPEYRESALVLIAVVVFAYTGLGGLNTVVKTDRIQFGFMLLVAIGIVLWLCFQKPAVTITDFFPAPMPLSDGLFLKWPLLLNMVIVNILLIPSMLRNWQLMAATRNFSEVGKGLMKGFGLTAFISALFVVLGILFFNIFPHTELSLNGILSSMADSNDKVLSMILLPLLFIACLMALLSTVDSSLLPVVQSISFDFGGKHVGRKKYLTITALLLLLTLGVYLIVFKLLGFDLIEWLFTIFSLVTISSPAIILGCVGNQTVLRKKSMVVGTIIATIVGLALSLLISYLGNVTENIWLIQLNTPIAAFVDSIILFIVYKVNS